MMITKSTLAKQAYEEIHRLILSGELPLGEKLRPADLAARLHISQTPVKEALAMLERDGLVEGEDRKGTMVRQFSKQDIEKVFEARILLETNALNEGFAQSRVTPAFHRTLADFAANMEELGQAHGLAKLAEFLRLDREMHAKIVGLAQNPLFSEWHEVVLWQTQTIITYSVENYDFARTVAEHRQLVAAICEGEPDAAVAYLRTHLVESRNDLLKRSDETLPVKPGR
ncbi:GntR family transcriptional regulator [Polycladidibacter hongkongensis]|uniref:GntR family transcriptional regulator n=1 Tax=Polycladidibacter hongkongensis TaxID=1647556 RepID=UPI00082FF510|nr:GntR family transcriptional regulator [Pseudovibrio hongkongensis]